MGLLLLDLVGFIPGVSFLSSAAAAAVLLGIDARGLVTLNGLIKWKGMEARRKLLVAVLEVALFQFLVLTYIVQRLFSHAKGAVRPNVLNQFAEGAVQSAVAAEPEEPTSATSGGCDAMYKALNSLESEAQNGLPQDLLAKVREVVAAISDILPAYAASGLDQQDRFVVERTAHDYLPSAVHSYLKLPSAYASIPLPEADGKTASQVLSDQLDLLVHRMRQIAGSAYRKDLEALLVHGRFLHSKFGPSSLSLNY